MIDLIPPQPIVITLASLPFLMAAFQGLTLSVILWFLKSSTEVEGYSANRLLSGFLLVLSIVLVAHAADTTGYYFYAPALIDTTAPFYLLIGPLLWGYVKLQSNQQTVQFRWPHLVHLLPAVLQLCMVLPFILNTQYEAKLFYFYDTWFPELGIDTGEYTISCPSYLPWHWNTCLVTLQSVVGKPQYDLILKSPLALLWLTNIGLVALWVSLIGYFSHSMVLLQRHRETMHQLASSPASRELRWLTHFILFFSAIAAFYIVTSFQHEYLDSELIGDDTRETIVYWMLSIGVVYMGVLAVLQPVIFSKDIRIDSPPAQSIIPASTNTLPSSKPTQNGKKYRNSPLTSESMGEMRAQLEQHLNTHKSYLDPELSLKSLSEQIGIGPHALSQVINDAIGMNFFDCINGYRLEAVKRDLVQERNRNILQIATDAGFNSKSSFYQFFRKREGMTPSQWRKMSVK